MPHETVDAMTATANIMTALQTVVSRNVHPLEPAVVSVGELLASLFRASARRQSVRFMFCGDSSVNPPPPRPHSPTTTASCFSSSLAPRCNTRPPTPCRQAGERGRLQFVRLRHDVQRHLPAGRDARHLAEFQQRHTEDYPVQDQPSGVRRGVRTRRHGYDNL